jgi:hypothetical protein
MWLAFFPWVIWIVGVIFDIKDPPRVVLTGPARVKLFFSSESIWTTLLQFVFE